LRSTAASTGSSAAFNSLGSYSPPLAAMLKIFSFVDTPSACGGVVHFLKIYRRKSEASKDIYKEKSEDKRNYVRTF
jgi:hypothetical protein